MRRYGPQILTLPAADGIALLEFAFNDEWEHNVFLRWIAGHEFGMSFSEFLEAAKPVPIKSASETLKDVETILNSTQWRREDGDI